MRDMNTNSTAAGLPENNVYRDNKASPEFIYLEKLIQYRLASYLSSDEKVEAPLLPELNSWYAPLANFISENKLTPAESVLLIIAFAPFLHPDLFDRAIESKLNDAGNFPKIGGVRGKNSRSFLPTGETTVFLLAGDDVHNRIDVQQLFNADHLFARKRILWLEELPVGEPPLSGRIILSQDYADTFMFGKPSAPHFSMSFPARLISEKRNWDALVINGELQSQIAEIRAWLKYNNTLMQQWGMHDRLKKGYRALFHGPPGTGKTLAAGLLAKEMNRDIYRIDLSMVVSKYIGETEKNLEMLFARAEEKGWILFFDEADALFGKRTNVRDAHDKYANQEVSYLLQRIEDYDGLIILATNMKTNIDDAFMRRFNAILKFPFPDAEERAQIWEKSFPGNVLFAIDQDNGVNGDTVHLHGFKNKLPEEIKKYELAGGSIINVVHYASIKAIEKANSQTGADTNAGSSDAVTSVSAPSFISSDNTPPSAPVIYLSDLLHGIKRELSKEGKPFLR